MTDRGDTRPILFVDVDGVISLFGFREGYGLGPGAASFDDRPPGALHSVNGVMHYLSSDCGAHLVRLARSFELVWASGWEETANEYLPHLLGLDVRELPYLRFDGRPRAGIAHWKIGAIAEYAGSERPLAWIDDCIDDECRAWAKARPAPTLLIQTQRDKGLCEEHVNELLSWTAELRAEA